MEGWFQDRRDHHGRSMRFMHIDLFVDWVVTHHLVNELRIALNEQGIDTEHAPGDLGNR